MRNNELIKICLAFSKKHVFCALSSYDSPLLLRLLVKYYHQFSRLIKTPLY